MPRKKAEGKRGKKKESSGLSRRNVLKLGAAAGGVTLLTSTKSFRTHFETVASAQGGTTDCLVNPGQSPPTTPFVQALPIPPVKQQTNAQQMNPFPTKHANIAGGEAPRADHQRWEEFPPVIYYDLDVRPAMHRFHPELPLTPIWGFDGLVPGPTFVARQGQPILVRFRNNLPMNHAGSGGWGIEQTTVHLHNGHTASESDGFAGNFFNPGLFYDNHYPNVLAGYDAFPATKGDPREAMYTLWYHDHRQEFTAPNSYRGLAGMYLMRDDKDPGNEVAGGPNSLHLPSGYGLWEIPLILSSKTFCPDGQLFGGPPGGAPPNGDKFCVNGAIQPYLEVKRRKYRFRMVNTGPARIWTMTLDPAMQFKVIATDGNLLEHPIDVSTLNIGVAERYDFVLDFSQAQIGDHIYLRNNQAMFVGGGAPNPLPANVQNIIMEFRVTGNAQDHSEVPATLCEYPPLPTESEIVGTRIWNFDLSNGVFNVNGQIFDAERSDAQVQKGTAERWILRSALPAAGWTHPVHIHFEEFRVLSRGLPVELGGPGPQPPPPLETGRKDTIQLRGRDQVELVMRFRDFTGKYLIHCHNMAHEDNVMMVRWDIVDSGGGQQAANFIPNPNFRKGGLS